MKKRENILMGVGIILLVVAIVGVSYAAFSYTGAGSKLNTITTGVISMSYTESDNVISMDKALPTTDDTGKVRLRDGEYFDFTVSSTIEGNAIINYEVAAEALSSNTFDGYNVKLYLTKIVGVNEEEAMFAQPYFNREVVNARTGTPAGMMSLTTGTMGASETIKYRLRMYVKEEYNPQDDNGNEVFQVKINVYGKMGKASTGTLIKAYSDGDFRAEEYRLNTTSIVTKDNNKIPEAALASWDISEAGDGKAVAYIEDDGTGIGTYKLTLGGEGGLLANSDMSYYFSHTWDLNADEIDYSLLGFPKIKTVDLTYLDTSRTNNMSYMFAHLGDFNSAEPPIDNLDLSMFDTSNVTDMHNMFDTTMTSKINVSGFDTSNVVDMSYMFAGAFWKENLDLSNFSGTSLMNVEYMFVDSFSGEIKLNGLGYSPIESVAKMFSMSGAKKIVFQNFYAPNLVSTSEMFSNSSNLEELDLNKFDTSSVINMSYMFANTGLKLLDLSDLDTSNVTDMSGMFGSSIALRELNLNNLNTSKVTNMESMFMLCWSLISLDLSNFDTSNVTNMSEMFMGADNQLMNLETLNLTSFDTSKVTDMSSMFYCCSSLTSIEVGNKWVIGSSTNVNYMFRKCGTDHVTYV